MRQDDDAALAPASASLTSPAIPRVEALSPARRPAVRSSLK